MSRTQKVIAIVAGATLLLAAGIWIGRRDSMPGDRAEGTPTVSSSPHGKNKGGSKKADKARTQEPVPSGTVFFSARARSIQATTSDVTASSFRVKGRVSMNVRASKIVDGKGKSRGAGSVTVTGSTVAVTSPDMTVGLGTWTLKPSGATLGHLTNLDWTNRITVKGGTFSFTKEGSSKSTTIAGPVRGSGDLGSVSITSMDPLTWTDPPARFDLQSTERTNFSWAGSGTLRSDVKRVRTEYGGIAGKSLDVRIRRSGNRLKIDGEAIYSQLYSNGRPILRAKGEVVIKSRPATTVRGSRGSFTWAPTNRGATDLCITRIRPGNAAGNWVNVGLSTLDPMFGGEKHRLVGGKADPLDDDGGSFFGGPSPITATIQTGTGDERTITFDVPEGTRPGTKTIELILDGNFKPMIVRLRVKVTSA